MIVTAQSITCDRCGRPDLMQVDSATKARAQLAAEGWRIEDADICGTCQADEGLTVAQVASDYLPNPVDDLEATR